MKSDAQGSYLPNVSWTARRKRHFAPGGFAFEDPPVLGWADLDPVSVQFPFLRSADDWPLALQLVHGQASVPELMSIHYSTFVRILAESNCFFRYQMTPIEEIELPGVGGCLEPRPQPRADRAENEAQGASLSTGLRPTRPQYPKSLKSNERVRKCPQWPRPRASLGRLLDSRQIAVPRTC